MEGRSDRTGGASSGGIGTGRPGSTATSPNGLRMPSKAGRDVVPVLVRTPSMRKTETKTESTTHPSLQNVPTEERKDMVRPPNVLDLRQVASQGSVDESRQSSEAAKAGDSTNVRAVYPKRGTPVSAKQRTVAFKENDEEKIAEPLPKEIPNKKKRLSRLSLSLASIPADDVSNAASAGSALSSKKSSRFHSPSSKSLGSPSPTSASGGLYGDDFTEIDSSDEEKYETASPLASLFNVWGKKQETKVIKQIEQKFPDSERKVLGDQAAFIPVVRNDGLNESIARKSFKDLDDTMRSGRARRIAVQAPGAGSPGNPSPNSPREGIRDENEQDQNEATKAKSGTPRRRKTLSKFDLPREQLDGTTAQDEKPFKLRRHKTLARIDTAKERSSRSAKETEDGTGNSGALRRRKTLPRNELIEPKPGQQEPASPPSNPKGGALRRYKTLTKIESPRKAPTSSPRETDNSSLRRRKTNPKFHDTWTPASGAVQNESETTRCASPTDSKDKARSLRRHKTLSRVDVVREKYQEATDGDPSPEKRKALPRHRTFTGRERKQSLSPKAPADGSHVAEKRRPLPRHQTMSKIERKTK